tara:strand:- start:292 stop:471 length:180 start_codon:yes stop_codon:yes gene_type:complete
MFYDQELIVRLFAAETLAIASSIAGRDNINPLLFFHGGNYEEDYFDYYCYDCVNWGVRG